MRTAEDNVPTTMSLRFCPACGRTDRFAWLKANHYYAGSKCKGQIILVAQYRLTTIKGPARAEVEEAIT